MGKLRSSESTEMHRWVWVYRTCVYVCICPCMHVGELGIHHQMLSEQHIIKVSSSKTERHCSSGAICYFYFLLLLFLAYVLASETFFYSTTPLALWQHSSSRDGAFCSCLKGPSLSFINPSNMSAAFRDDIINVALKTPAPVQSEAQERHRVFWNCTSAYEGLANPSPPQALIPTGKPGQPSAAASPDERLIRNYRTEMISYSKA